MLIRRWIGVLPLVFSKGAGAELRHTLGVAVFSGMLGVTGFGIFLTRVFYNVLQKLADRRRPSGVWCFERRRCC
jgi:multidrug efflux pump subunit AcrB